MFKKVSFWQFYKTSEKFLDILNSLDNSSSERDLILSASYSTHSALPFTAVNGLFRMLMYLTENCGYHVLPIENIRERDYVLQYSHFVRIEAPAYRGHTVVVDGHVHLKCGHIYSRTSVDSLNFNCIQIKCLYFPLRVIWIVMLQCKV